MGLTEVFMATGYSAATDDVTRQSGDLALVEQTDNGLAVYWNQVSPLITRIRKAISNTILAYFFTCVWGSCNAPSLI